MAKLQVGGYIAIPCKVNPGPFEDELQVEFSSIEGTVSGFTAQRNITHKGGRPFITGRVQAIEGDVVTVMVAGSFFTTNGLANFRSSTLEELPVAA